MSDTPDQDFSAPFHGRKISYQRGHVALLWHFEVIPKQGCEPTADGIPGDQGAREYRRGCDHGH